MNVYGAISGMVTGGWGWCRRRGWMPFLAFLQWSVGWGRCSSQGWCWLWFDVPTGFLPELTPHSFLFACGQEQSIVIQKMPHQGNPCVWPGKLPCRLGQRVWWGLLAGWVLVRQVSSPPGPVRRPLLESHQLSIRAGGLATPGPKTSAFHPGRKAVPNTLWFHFLWEVWFGFSIFREGLRKGMAHSHH